MFFLDNKRRHLDGKSLLYVDVILLENEHEYSDSFHHPDSYEYYPFWSIILLSRHLNRTRKDLDGFKSLFLPSTLSSMPPPYYMTFDKILDYY